MNIPLTFEKSPLLINAVSKVSFSSSTPFWFTSQVNRHFVLFAFSTFVHLGIIGNWFPSFRFSIEERISSKAMPQSLNYIMNKWKGCKQALQTEKFMWTAACFTHLDSNQEICSHFFCVCPPSITPVCHAPAAQIEGKKRKNECRCRKPIHNLYILWVQSIGDNI